MKEFFESFLIKNKKLHKNALHFKEIFHPSQPCKCVKKFANNNKKNTVITKMHKVFLLSKLVNVLNIGYSTNQERNR